MSKIRIYWICQILGWSLFGFANILTYSFQRNQLELTDIFGEVLQILFYIASTHFLRFLIKKGNWVAIPPLRLIPMALFADLVLGLLNYMFLLLISFMLGILITSVELKSINILLGILGPTAMYFLWSLIYFTFHYFQQYNKSLKYEAVINEIELNHLKTQLNPHFIFNALNSIRGLVDENPAKSKSAITRLSNILRNSLTMDKKKLIDLEEEIGIVQDYLELESIRYEERLKVSYEIRGGVNAQKVPPMMMQTLVENAVKHGIARLKDGGEIKIGARKLDNDLIINIENSGQYNGDLNTEAGYGLSNTKKRLELIYGDKAALSISNTNKDTVLTTIVIPIEK
ncbi:MAG: histidine kinase [Cyclobacteriaceae bacterium]